MAKSANFERAEITDAQGNTVRVLTCSEFWSLGLVERVTLLKDGHVKFFRGQTTVKAMDALK